MAIITNEKISLVIYNNGLNFETFKTFKDLLKTAVIKRINELQRCTDESINAASIKVKKEIIEIIEILNEFIEAEKDESENVCPISGAANCHECDQSQIKKCNKNYG